MNKAVVFGLLGLGMSLAIEQSACCRYTLSMDEMNIRRTEYVAEKTAYAIMTSSDMEPEERICLFDMSSLLMDRVKGDEKIALQIEGMLRPIAIATIPGLYDGLLSCQESLIAKRITSNVPCVSSDVPCISSDVPCVSSDVPCISSNVPCISSDVPCVSSNVPCVSSDVPSEMLMKHRDIVRERCAIANAIVRKMRLEWRFSQECWLRIFQEIGMVDETCTKLDASLFNAYSCNHEIVYHGILHGNINAVPEGRMIEYYCIFDVNEAMVYRYNVFNSMHEVLSTDIAKRMVDRSGILPFYLFFQDIKKICQKQSVAVDKTIGIPSEVKIKALMRLNRFIRIETSVIPEDQRVYVSQLVPFVVPLSRLDVLEVFGKELTKQLLWDSIFEAYFSEKKRTFGEELVTAPAQKIVAADKDATSSSEK